MEILNNLTPITDKQSRRCGRGIGSGLGGHTTGRGAKGDKVRGKTKLTFDGTKIKKGWLKRTPFLRGKHRLLPFSKPEIINLDFIDKAFSKANEIVDNVSLSKKIKTNATSFKILGRGDISKALVFKGLFISKSAKTKIEKSGSKIE
jgi:large subunit ribosomal protein L15